MSRTEKTGVVPDQAENREEASSLSRLAIRVSGVVQGVGFRPFVYNLAVGNSLAGYVLNANGSVEIEVQGQRESLKTFLDQLTQKAPPLARIDRLETREISLREELAEEGFKIKASLSSGGDKKVVPADTATCADCLRELFDPTDRRFRYPFVNCTNCGPRFTIIRSLPYDRPATTMSEFVMCEQCRSEYDNPGDRRFHAQPNACAACGPILSFLQSRSGKQAESQIFDSPEALRHAVERLRAGEIIAVKGLGGFHLMCDAGSEEAVARLRTRKRRLKRPLAVMMSDLETVREYCETSQCEEKLLSGTERPIVLLSKGRGLQLAGSVAPGVDKLGVMLPYTPLHHLLLADFGSPLVATSGNLSDEPIVVENQEAIDRLDGIADGFLIHDRSIASRYDDSVARIFGNLEVLVRRSRGYAPLPLRLPFKALSPVLACGAHLKNTFCLISGDSAYVSQHIGDLDNEYAREHYYEALARFTSLFSVSPEIVVHDLHPDYLSTSIAGELSRERNWKKIAVQHHHAHIVSCMVEHMIDRPVIGVAFDGLGYGTDGTLWGGEFLLCEWSSFERRAYFEPVPLPGGTAGIKQPWRMALSYLSNSAGANKNVLDQFVESLAGKVDPKALALVRQQIKKRVNSPSTSSCGRLFDAFSALLGICLEASYEGQAAIELESVAGCATAGGAGAFKADTYRFDLQSRDGAIVISPYAILEEAIDELRQGAPQAHVAAKFHRTIAQIVFRVCVMLRHETGLTDVCLSGGVFQNVLLLTEVEKLLRLADFGVFFPRRLPANDGGLSLGQAVAALAGAKEIAREENA